MKKRARKTKTIQIRTTEETHARLVDQSIREGISLSSLCNRILTIAVSPRWATHKEGDKR